MCDWTKAITRNPERWSLLPKQNGTSVCKKYEWWLLSRQPKMLLSVTDDYYVIKSTRQSLNSRLTRKTMLLRRAKRRDPSGHGKKESWGGRLPDQRAIGVWFKGNNEITGSLYLVSGSLELLMGHWSSFYVLNGDKWSSTLFGILAFRNSAGFSLSISVFS